MSSSPQSPVPAEIEALLRSAVLAPSSHNTQPWRFAVSDDRIRLRADRTRALPVNDPDDRELTISCGCALLNLRVAAAAAGMEVRVVTLPDRDDEDLLATVELHKSGDGDAEAARLMPAVADRRTYRKRFAARAVPTDVLTRLSANAEAEGARLQPVEGEAARHGVASLVAEGDAAQWANPSWRRELAAWMHPRRKGDGLTVPGLIGPVAQLAVRSFDMGGGVGARDKELADGSPVLAVLGTGRDDVAAWLAAGQALERVLLTARRDGLQASYLNQPIQVAAVRPKLQHVVGGSGFPQILLRLGYADEDPPAAPRRALAEVVD